MDNHRSTMAAREFVSWASTANEELMVTAFDELDPDIKDAVLRDIGTLASEKLVRLLPYNKYDAIYNRVIRSKIDSSANLMKFVSKFYYQDAMDLLSFVFQQTKDEEVCRATAEGLAKSTQGLSILEGALEKGTSIQQASAAMALSQIVSADSHPEIVEIFKKYRAHENYRVRLECIVGLYRSKNLTSDYLRAAFQDEDEHVRRRAMHLIRKIDSSVSKDYVVLLEDRKGYIVNEALETLSNHQFWLDEEALADAIISELVIRETGRPPEYFNTEIIATAFRSLFEWNSRLYGQTLKALCDIAFSNKGAIRRRASLVAITLDERGFLAQVNENAENDPQAAKEILNLVTGNLDANVIANQISGTDPSDVQQNAANQIKLLAQYHESGLQQAKTSFNWAIALSLTGFPFLILAVYYLLINQSESPTSIISSIASVLVEFIAGTLFYLYNQTRKQLTYYHQQMNQIQRFLLANSVAESLESSAKENARIELIKTISTVDVRDDIKKP